jgi:hypothetical protein
LAVGRVLIGWLLAGGLLHLVLTMMGGRGDTGSVMNVVAWAALPLAIRSLVRAIIVYAGHSLIASPGLSGFITSDGGNLRLFLSAFLEAVDIFTVWYVVLLLIGVRAGNGISWPKALTGVFLVVLLILCGQALIRFGTIKLGGMILARPFF